MDRIGGWYKRWSQNILLGIAAIVVVAANADTLMLTKRFMRDNALRTSVVAAVEKAVRNNPGNTADNPQDRQNWLREAEKLTLPLGWVAINRDAIKADPATDYNDLIKDNQFPDSFVGWLMKIIGLLVSLFAVSLGAPFW